MDNKDDNQWGTILKKKEEANKVFDREIQEKRREEKNLYKKDLDLQAKLREHDKSITREAKKTDILSVNLHNKIMQNDELKRKLERIELQKFLTNQYDLQSNYSKSQKQKEYKKLQNSKAMQLKFQYSASNFSCSSTPLLAKTLTTPLLAKTLTTPLKKNSDPVHERLYKDSKLFSKKIKHRKNF